MYRQCRGGETPLPIVDEDGLASGRYLSGRVYCMWTWPAPFPPQRVESEEREIVRFTSFWATREGVDLRQEHVKILSRPMEMSLTRWQPRWLERQRLLPWKEAGRVIQSENGNLVLVWDAGFNR